MIPLATILIFLTGAIFGALAGLYIGYFKIKPKTTAMHTTLSFEEIAVIVCNRFRVNMDAITSASRHHDVVMPRFVLQYLAVEYLHMGVTKVGKLTNRNHSSVIKAIRVLQHDRKHDAWLNSKVTSIEQEIAAKSQLSLTPTF